MAATGRHSSTNYFSSPPPVYPSIFLFVHSSIPTFNPLSHLLYIFLFPASLTFLLFHPVIHFWSSIHYPSFSFDSALQIFPHSFIYSPFPSLLHISPSLIPLLCRSPPPFTSCLLSCLNEPYYSSICHCVLLYLSVISFFLPSSHSHDRGAVRPPPPPLSVLRPVVMFLDEGLQRWCSQS